MIKRYFYGRLTLLILILSSLCGHATAKESFNSAWKFQRLTPTEASCDEGIMQPSFDDSKWQSVSLPHTAKLEPLLVNDQWQGICWYRKHFEIPNYSAHKRYFIEFEAAMNHTTIWINGAKVSVSQGGYLPIVVDATNYLKGGDNVIALRLDNQDNPTTGPKPLKILDFNMYGGIYRNAWLITKNRIHITHPILADTPASGGVWVTTPKVSQQESTVRVQTHLANQTNAAQQIVVVHKIFFKDKLVKTTSPSKITISANGESKHVDSVIINSARLWSPASPNLYSVQTSVWSGKTLVDSQTNTFGIREFAFRDNELYINGERTFLRGVNRHQDYPYIGYALSDNAQYRDAAKIKQSGFDYVRLSHYPQSPAFMRACDELGLVVADAILGWQYYLESEEFKNQCYNSARNLIRRDRNHPCVLTWEVSLNETKMPVTFMRKLNSIVHEEYPGNNVYSCGWLPGEYDIYFQARQHRILHPKAMIFEKPYMVSEYGDWEYYSTNAGLNQHQYSQEKRLELSSRQLRSDGEVRLLQQAKNLQEAHNDNMDIPAAGDSYWVMFDYNRGYQNTLEASGVMDIFRLPKFAYDLYRSQRTANDAASAVLSIASYWDSDSPTSVTVYSNCDKVSLYLNDKLVATQLPDKDKISTNLAHPPFTFNVGRFESGTLRAEGFIGTRKIAQTEVKTAAAPVAIKCWLDRSGREPEAGCNDVLFLYMAAVDSNGTICHNYTSDMSLTTDPSIEVLNTDGVKTEAGIATALLRIGDNATTVTISASTKDGLKGEYSFKIKSMSKNK